MSECVTCTPPQKPECVICKKPFKARGTTRTCGHECSGILRRSRMAYYKKQRIDESKRREREPAEYTIHNITKKQREAVAMAAKQYERCRAEWDRCKSLKDVASIRSELDAAEHALALALSRQGLRVATVDGLRYRVDAVGELVRQEIVRAIHRSEQPRRTKADAAARA